MMCCIILCVGYLEAVDLTYDTERLSDAAQQNTHTLKGAGEGAGMGKQIGRIHQEEKQKQSPVTLGLSFFAHKLHMKE